MQTALRLSPELVKDGSAAGNASLADLPILSYAQEEDSAVRDWFEQMLMKAQAYYGANCALSWVQFITENANYVFCVN